VQAKKLADGREHWEFYDKKGLKRADVWGTVWYTWNVDGSGGENGVELDVGIAVDEADAALVRQGWNV
jgi:maltoporin